MRYGEDDPTAVGIGDVVETKKVSRTPTNPRTSAHVKHGLDLDLGRLPGRDNGEELIARFLGLEASGGPGNEVRNRRGVRHASGYHAADISEETSREDEAAARRIGRR
jgi:hypothetical protein